MFFFTSVLTLNNIEEIHRQLENGTFKTVPTVNNAVERDI